MLFNNLMETDTITTNKFISSIKRLNTDNNEHGTIKALLKNFILPETDMAIKHAHDSKAQDTCVYTVPISPPVSERTKALNEAKQAFLNSNMLSTNAPIRNIKEETNLHYAQLAIATHSEDARSTGGGRDVKSINNLKNKLNTLPVDFPSNAKKKIDSQPRKVSFKIKNATSHRRPPLAKTVTITSTKVAELTKKFNELNESQNGSIKLVKTIESTNRGTSNSSTPSSTLSSSPNIKIVLRHRKGNKKRNHRKRCSSVDSIDKLVLSDSSSTKIRVIRSKSDGNKIPKSPKKKLIYPDCSGQQSGSDSVDGGPPKVEKEKPKPPEKKIVVRNFIKKFESEIISHSTSYTLRRQSHENKSTIPVKEKPKVPEKKSTIVLTRNLVVKDGIPKIRTIKPNSNEVPVKSEAKDNIADISKRKDHIYDINKEPMYDRKDEPIYDMKKEPIYDRKKYKTNYIHSDKLPLHVVEIIQEDVNEGTAPSSQGEQDVSPAIASPPKDTIYQDVNPSSSNITPNESFLWRRKSSTQIYTDSDISVSDSPYGSVSIVINDTTITCSDDTSDISRKGESLTYEDAVESHAEKIECKTELGSDFETNIVEAVNNEVMIGFTTKPKKATVVEDDYEPLEPRDDKNVLIIPVKTTDRSSKINCPLPEIPKQSLPKSPQSEKENIYQCLLEMRSHPEGDESSLHNYELCERTRGDGDSDDGYEYCKSPIKPYCLTSSSGIQIAEDYNPYDLKTCSNNYTIAKSVSGASTVSYEKIGPDTPERIYEKIPPRPPKQCSPNSKRNSIISDYTGYNDSENIYDTIKQSDATSASHAYESIPNSPSMVKLRHNLKRHLASAAQKRLSFDTVSNISQSTLSSEQKTNSIYGQRSVISFNGQEIAFQVPSSEISASGSDRSDEWVDVSDEEKTDEQKIIIVRERSRGRKSPVSWSQKVRHQWHKSPKPRKDNQVFITSPTNVYIDTSAKCPYYSVNDEVVIPQKVLEYRLKCIHVPEQKSWLNIRTVLTEKDAEIQDIVVFIDCDSSDSGHVYESLEPALPSPCPPLPLPPLIDDDFDSFDSDSDDDHDKPPHSPQTMPSPRLPTPPSSGQYTLTKIASAAQKKMRQIKRNLTKRYSVAMDGKPFSNTSQANGNGTYDVPKTITSPIYENCERHSPTYTNINFNDTKHVLNTHTNGYNDHTNRLHLDKPIPPPLPEKSHPEKSHPEKPVTPTSEGKKDNGTLSRKTYFSFKSRFRRASSMAVDINEVPSALKITNSTFYLTDSMDGDSGFSNCDNIPGSIETLSPQAPGRRHRKARWAESSPCLVDRPNAVERPSVPPPPPPDIVAVNEELKRLLPSLSRKERTPRTRTSWYAECGAGAGAGDTTPPPPAAAAAATAAARVSNASWYAEAGLYQAGNVSTSSGASSDSYPASPLPHSLFTHEPLYQFYNAQKVESVCRETGDSDSDAYETSSTGAPALPSPPPGSTPSRPAPRPSAMTLAAPRGPQRTLWCEVPEVLNSAVLSSLAPAQKRLQEAKFELLTSEASYLNSLNVLFAHFIAHPVFRETHILPRADWEALFATILPVRKCSQLLMNELEKCWQDNILLTGICDIVRKHADQHFQVYVKYCEHQATMMRTLQRLRERPTFATALRRLENHPACQSLSLHSFLMLPMQRVTRLPLLLDAVLKNLNSSDVEHEGCMLATATLNNFVSQCNEGARNTERIEEMFRLAHSIEFPAHIKNPPSLGPSCGRRDRRPVRWLVRSGEVTQLVWKTDELKLTFGKKFHKVPLHLFLFNDLLVITKKKGEDSYVAVDHCWRSLLEVCSSDGGAANAKHALLLTLLENHEGRTLEMLMSCPSETDASRWSEALCPPYSGEEGEAVYAGWDCPQAVALYAYQPTQPDELMLHEGDVVNVTRKTSEGWYYGERTRDGEAGWFPGAYTTEIASAHVRARNLRQRYRLLALSATYLGQKKKPNT